MSQPRAHKTAQLLLQRINSEAPAPAPWMTKTRGRSDCETLLAFAQTHFSMKQRFHTAPGDLLIFRMSAEEAAQTPGVMGGNNFFTYHIPGREDCQTSYLGHFWRSRLIAVFSVPDSYLDALPLAAE